MRTALTIAVGLALAACGGSGDVAPDASTIPRATITVMQHLPQQNLIEGSWMAGPGDQIQLSITTSQGEIDFDIHGHQGGGTQEVTAAFGQTEIDYDFVPTEQAQWYLLVRNSAPNDLTINVDMTLYGSATWNGWM